MTRGVRCFVGMKRAEIDFCERWCELRGDDGLVPYADRVDSVRGAVQYVGRPDHMLMALTSRGADLVATYEAALAQGLPIVADDDSERSLREVNEKVGPACPTCQKRSCGCVPCPDCVDGFIGIPIEYGERGGILRVWPATCPTCKGAVSVRASSCRTGANEHTGSTGGWSEYRPALGRSIQDVADDLGRQPAPPLTEWQQLTVALGERLFRHRGEVEIRHASGGHVWRGHVAAINGSGLTLDGLPMLMFDGTWWARAFDDGWQPLTLELAPSLEGEEIEFRLAGRQTDVVQATVTAVAPDRIEVEWQSRGALGWSGRPKWQVRLVHPWTTDPQAMRDLLRECSLSGAAIDAKWSGGEDLRLAQVDRVDRVEFEDDGSGWWARLACRMQDGDREDWWFAIDLPVPGDSCTPVLTAVRRH